MTALLACDPGLFPNKSMEILILLKKVPGTFLKSTWYLFLVPVLAQGVEKHQRLSLEQLSQKLPPREQIAEKFKSSKLSYEDKKLGRSLGPWIAKTQAGLLGWERAVDESKSFQRGQIEEELILNRVISLIQLEILKARSLVTQARYAKAQVVFERLVKFAADFAYDESSLVGLRFSHLVRQLTLDELEALERAQSLLLIEESWQKLAKNLRAPWPMDRVILEESRKVLGQRELRFAEQIALALQKNSYQTAESLVKSLGRGSPKLEFLIPMWRSQDIEMMKQEAHRIISLRVRWATLAFEKQRGSKPVGIEQLVKEKFLAELPLNYLTGKPLQLQEVAMQ